MEIGNPVVCFYVALGDDLRDRILPEYWFKNTEQKKKLGRGGAEARKIIRR